MDCLHFDDKRANTQCVDFVSEELQIILAEHTLADIDNDAVVRQVSEERTQILCVIFSEAACNEDVVVVRVAKRQTVQHPVDETLKRLCSIFEFEWHSDEFKETEWCCDWSLLDVGRFNWDLVVRLDQINFEKRLWCYRVLL